LSKKFSSNKKKIFSLNILGKKFSSNQIVYFFKIYWARNFLQIKKYNFTKYIEQKIFFKSKSIFSKNILGKKFSSNQKVYFIKI